MEEEEEEEEDAEVEEEMMLKRKTDPKTGKHTLCESGQATCTRTFHKSHFAWTCTGKLPYVNPATPVLCQPAQTKCTWITWTCHKSHFVEIYRENARRFRCHLD